MLSILRNIGMDIAIPTIGATHDAFWSVDHVGGHEKAYCCLNSNTRDFAGI